ncbi:branched-chain amino acid ABC transporter permease [Salinigranum halophilum]|uniref:branched-chain amino acid ABC transporter permease n=1 Tax=Salinigranum halophilum TaxID=2565931 RepID=UPI00115CB05E|nr:branched-chain amino acid ABC transporter permease [Salinigranum halophilum]
MSLLHDITPEWFQDSTRIRAALFGAVLAVLLLDILRRLLGESLAPALLTGYLWNGLVFGLVIGLAGVGLSLTYDLLGFANFAHGDYISISAFIGWGSTYLVAGLGEFSPLNLFFLGVGDTVFPRDVGISVTNTPGAVIFGLVVAAVGGATVALLLDRFVYQSIRKTGAITLLIASIGVAFTLRFLIVFLYTQNSFGLTVGAWTYALSLPGGAVNISAPDLMLVTVAVASMVSVHLLLTRTKLGKAMRAMSANRDLARVTGIPSERVITATWLLGGALAGLAGFMIALFQGTINYQLGWTLLLLVFAGVIMGGIGSVYGAIAGGVLIGLVTRVSQIWIPASFAEAVGFAVMIAILLTRPSGIFGSDAL